MANRWQIIDDNGSRDVLVDHETGRVVSGVKVSHTHCEWPPFTQFAVHAPLDDVTDALEDVAREFDLPCRPCASSTRGREHRVEFAQTGDLTLIGEPGVPFDDRFVTAASSEALVEYLETDGVHFGHDPQTGSLHLTTFVDGAPDFTWCDSLQPGPSFALTFHDDGRCTEEDPRRFALRRMGAERTGGCLDRRAFILEELHNAGLATIDPDFQETDSTMYFAVATDERRTPMMQ
ncbi:MAG: hypothetical protein ABEN55_02125 [Bradymonadaceae bacterium]